MADWKAFHDRAKQLKPNEPVKPTSYWIGILGHEKQPEQALTQDDFIWVKCHGKITFQTIKAEYEKRTFVGEPIVLNSGSVMISDKTTVAEADFYSDKHVIVHAKKISLVANGVKEEEPIKKTDPEAETQKSP